MISLLIIAHEEQERLSLHLPALLAQEGVKYEVVVVDMNSEDDTLDILKKLEEQYPHLHHLSIPLSARDISRERLALHLGMRATAFEHVLILNAGMNIPSPHWLADIEQRWRPDCDIMLVPTKRVRSKRLGNFFTAGHEAWRNSLYHRQAYKNRIFRVGASIVGLNKEIFLTHNSPAKHLALKTGALDIFVSHVANRYNTILLDEKELFPIEDNDNNLYLWRQRRLFDVETRKHLSRRLIRHLTYMEHCLSTIHKGAIPYSILDIYDYLRWMFTRKNTFIKKHY